MTTGRNWSAVTAALLFIATPAPCAVKQWTGATQRIRAAGNVAYESAHVARAVVLRDEKPLPAFSAGNKIAGGQKISIEKRGGAGMQQGDKPDRYVSFIGIEGDKNSRDLMTMLRRHIDDPAKSNRFWDMFKEKLARVGLPDQNGGRCLDELFLIHSYINNIRELFEEYDDRVALNLLEQIESESC
jgi:hypothetical protein